MTGGYFLEVYQRLKGRRWRIDVLFGRIYTWSWGAGQWLEVDQAAAFKFWQEELPCGIQAWARSLEARVFRNQIMQADEQCGETDCIGAEVERTLAEDLENADPEEDAIPL